MQTLFEVVRSMVSKVTAQQVKNGVHIIVRRQEVILAIEPGVMIISSPRSDEQANDHGNDKYEQ